MPKGLPKTSMVFLAGFVLACLVVSPASAQNEPNAQKTDVVETVTSPFDGLVFYCTRCKTEVPEQLGAGSSCPHCGAFFNSATNADGSDSSVDPPSTGFPMRYWGPVLLALIFGGEYAWRRWRRKRD